MEVPRAILLLLLTTCSLLIIPVASGVSYKTYNQLMEAMQEESWEISKGQPDPQSGKQLIEYAKGRKLSKPEEQGNYLEGDILFQRRPSGKRSLRNGYQYRWPNGIVYYTVADSFTGPQEEMIKKAMKKISNASCIQFKKRPHPYWNHPDYVSITRNNDGCYSSVGRQGGMQTLNLQKKLCMEEGTIHHELMHTLGFFHEQSRTDRNNFVTIHLSNIKQERVRNFKQRDDTDHLGIPYDYKSVMHYSRYAFAINRNLPTITINGNTDPQSGQLNEEMSARDFERIRALYACPATTSVQPPSSIM